VRSFSIVDKVKACHDVYTASGYPNFYTEESELAARRRNLGLRVKCQICVVWIS